MNHQQRSKLIEIAKKGIIKNDPAHDFIHALQVMKNAEKIAREEGGDLDIVIPAALFHNFIDKPKNDHNWSNFKSKTESAKKAGEILSNIPEFSKGKIEAVKSAIMACTGSRNDSISLEGKIARDADDLEATGAMIIARAFISAGVMKRPICKLDDDPFCKNRKEGFYTLDYLATRLGFEDKMYTKTASEMAKKRNIFLRKFFEELETEMH
ncbi:hypothetical protein A2Y26_02480 [candidate division CPR2 bacterium GWD2_39_7]|nr:MAG: Metal dependent phosphohydrolase [candidate division CPR2 bacterium GW2011_GWD1_39_7]OGB61405.1 MAG: hypothetical protein A2Y27_03320 [candidate division CPR2 bacterium GWD1_39_7]OGB72970.1 MAG: hypothetical protein A2Y26_02480 [candidate division CPR2 bacterium GWD2_39_7]